MERDKFIGSFEEVSQLAENMECILATVCICDLGYLLDDVVVLWVIIIIGDWDLLVMLKAQCQWSKLNIPTYFNRWIDIRKYYRSIYGKTRGGLIGALKTLNLQLSGRVHSGIDDCVNTAQILCRLIKDGNAIDFTTSIPNFSTKQINQILTRNEVPPEQQSPKKRKSTSEKKLCKCGVGAKQHLVRKPGPNLGKKFWR